MGEADKREAILEAALSLFVERGFHGTAVPLIAARAQVGAGTIYRYFESKETLVNELYRELKRSLASHVGEDFPTSGSPREQFHAFWARMVEWATKNPEAFAFLEFHSHDYLDRSSRKVGRQGRDTGLRMIEYAQEHHALKEAPPLLLVGIVLGILQGVMRVKWEAQGGLAVSDEDLSLAEQCAWEAIRV